LERGNATLFGDLTAAGRPLYGLLLRLLKKRLAKLIRLERVMFSKIDTSSKSQSFRLVRRPSCGNFGASSTLSVRPIAVEIMPLIYGMSMLLYLLDLSPGHEVTVKTQRKVIELRGEIMVGANGL